MKKLCVFLTSLLLVTVQMVQAQTVRITGTVTSSEDGMPLPGVSVIAKGTIIGTSTDVNGKYELNVPTDVEVLQFSFIGFKNQDVTIAGRTIIDVVLETESVQVEEVVVTALGVKREKREVTYQTQKVLSEDLTKISPSKAATALAGKVAGLQINIQDNGVNPNVKILLRGLRSISANNSALIVIDGAVSSEGAFNALNPNDIENISVLKGANAAALYGSQASNGALLVTTKSGKKGEKYTVGIVSSYTFEKVAYMPDFQTKYGTGWEGAYDPIENTNWGPRFDGQLRQIGPVLRDGSYQMVPYAPVKNNLLDFFDTGTTSNQTVYLTGSHENSTYYLSIGDQRTDGIVPNDTYRRTTFRVNASQKMGKIDLSANTSFFTDKSNVVGDELGHQDRPLYWLLLNTSANVPLTRYKNYKDPASWGYPDNYYNGYYENPYWAIGTTRNIDETSRLTASINLDWELLDWLSFTGRVSNNTSWGNGKNYRPSQEYDAFQHPSANPTSSFVEDTKFDTRVYTGDAIFNAKFTLSQDFSLKALVGGTVYSYKYTYNRIRANNLSIPNFYDISNGTGSLDCTATTTERTMFGYFGNATLGFRNYLFLDMSGRNDWVSTLKKGDNSYFYPSVGLSFIPTDAFEALKNNRILSFAKVTVSNSIVYNDLDPYKINERFFQATGFPYGSTNGFYIDNAAVDADISKEKINSTEFGLNLGFFRGRMTFDASYFITKTKDLITTTTPSYASGATSYLTNIGQLKGKGLELTLGGTILQAKDFKWDLSVNYFSEETKVDEITRDQKEITLYSSGQYGVFAVVDKAFPQIKANVYDRDPQGRIIVDPVSGHPLTKTGIYNLGKTTPDYIIGLNTSISYKGITISSVWDYRTGHYYFEQGSDQMEFTGRSIESVSANRQDFVIPNSVIETSPGVYVENTSVPVSGGRQSYWTDVYNEVKSNYVKDATALKLRELSVGYELPKKILAKTPFSKLTVSFIARNVMTWLPKENRFSDPEFNNSNYYTNDNVIGIGGYLQSPPTRSFGFNLNVEF